MSLRRVGSIAFAAVLGFAVWNMGPALKATQQPAFAAAVSVQINDLLEGAYHVTYFDVSSHFTPSQQGWGGPGSSGGTGDALVHLVDVGNYEADPVDGHVCANIYVFDDDQEMQECCSCELTADSLKTISVINNLTSNPQFGSPLGAGVIKIVTSRIIPTDGAGVSAAFPIASLSFCNSGGNGVVGLAGSLTPDLLTDGLTAWINHAESIASNQAGFTPPFGFVTSTSVTHFAEAELDSGELLGPNGLVPICRNIELHASGRGICSCGIGS